ncbi:hypothetical protein [Poriferisphaera corsica]|nr:hypothetical protein [Poriferisphaera corsica]
MRAIQDLTVKPDLENQPRQEIDAGVLLSDPHLQGGVKLNP